MSRLSEWFNRKTDRRHWYRVKFIYKDKKGNTLWDVTMNMSVTSRRYIINHRLLAKTFDIYKQAKIHNLKILNGVLYTEPVCYLGYFKK